MDSIETRVEEVSLHGWKLDQQLHRGRRYPVYIHIFQLFHGMPRALLFKLVKVDGVVVPRLIQLDLRPRDLTLAKFSATPPLQSLSQPHNWHTLPFSLLGLECLDHLLAQLKLDVKFSAVIRPLPYIFPSCLSVLGNQVILYVLG
jgi:hypothetical protein